MTEQEYRAHEAINISALCKIDKSPRAYKWHRDNPGDGKQTPAMSLGTAIHMYCLEPQKFDSVYRQSDAKRNTNVGKAEIAEIEALGFIPIKSKDVEIAKSIAGAIQDHPVAREIINSPTALKEKSILWEHDGVKLKGRLDGVDVDRGCVWDLKTCVSATAHDFAGAGARLNYFAKASFYQHAALYEYGVRLPWLFVAVEKSDEFAVGVYEIDDDSMDLGMRQWQSWLQTLKRCEAQDVWPDINQGMCEVLYAPGYLEAPVTLDIGGEVVSI